MRRAVLLAGVASLTFVQAHATTYLVSANGDGDFTTLQQAAARAQPGDTVEVGDGTYGPTSDPSYVVTVYISGTNGNPITYKAAPCAHPIIHVPNNAVTGFQVNANYILISGFEFAGDQASMSGGGTSTATGIIAGYVGSPQTYHHITLLNNTIHDMPGGGIGANGVDYVTIQGNVVSNSAFYNPWGGSGISVFEPTAVDGNAGYKIYVSGNIAFDNKQLVNSTSIGQNAITDGGGIILDSGMATGYNGRIRVENNVTYDNGGLGIHTWQTAHADVVGNTAYGNGDLSIGNQIALLPQDDSTMSDNTVTAGASIGAKAVSASTDASQSSGCTVQSAGTANLPSTSQATSSDPTADLYSSLVSANAGGSGGSTQADTTAPAVSAITRGSSDTGTQEPVSPAAQPVKAPTTQHAAVQPQAEERHRHHYHRRWEWEGRH